MPSSSARNLFSPSSTASASSARRTNPSLIRLAGRSDDVFDGNSFKSSEALFERLWGFYLDRKSRRSRRYNSGATAPDLNAMQEQLNSKKAKTARNPRSTFGTANRFNRNKVGFGFGSQAHATDMLCTHSPGPIYNPQPVTRKLPTWSWGSRRANQERQEREEFSRMHAYAEAGPAAYSANLANPPRNLHGFKFSTSDRFAAKQPGISKHHDLHMMNVVSPGPIYYPEKPTKNPVPSFSFGRSRVNQHGRELNLVHSDRATTYKRNNMSPRRQHRRQRHTAR